MKNDRIRILLVDDSEPLRRSIRSLLASADDCIVCGEAADGVEAVECAQRLQPDVVLMDISMPRMNGLEATRILRHELPNAAIIIVSQDYPPVAHEHAERIGVAAWVAKTNMVAELIPAIHNSLNGHKRAIHTAAETSSDPPPSPFIGGGEMGERICSFDWSSTALGPIDRWPESLKTAVRICIGSRNPMVLWWGRSANIQIYNDAYIPFLGPRKHPAFLGRSGAECWSEIWETMGPMWEQVFATGEAIWCEDFLYVLNRNLPREEGYFTFSYAPLYDDSGAIAGIFCPCYETTGRVVADRRLRTLRDLGQAVPAAKTAEAACKSAADVLATNPASIPFSLIYLLDDDARYAHLVAMTGFKSECDATPSRIELSASATNSPWPLKRVLEAQAAELITDLPQRLGPLPGGLWPESPENALVLPIASSGQSTPAGFLVSGISPRRIYDADYRSFLDLIAGHISTAIANARSYEHERKRAEALAEVDRAKTAFFSNVSHEFRTPLTLMLGPLQDLLTSGETQSSTGAHEQLELVNRNAVRLLRLVNALLDFSRIEAGRMHALYQPTDISELTAELASNFHSAVERAGLRLLVDCAEIDEPVYVDHDLWEKIVLNLLSNAFKFTFEGEIAVNLQRAGSEIELRVHDTGVGIPADALPKVFERFHRIPNTRSRTFEGSGIGLALVQELVKLHGGSIRVESAVNAGTTFIVRIPLGLGHLPADQIGASGALPSAVAAATPFVEEALSWLPDVDFDDALASSELLPLTPTLTRDANSSRPRILVADDNADMRQYLVRLLQSDYDVKAVTDGQAALTAVRTFAPDLVLSDVMMPIIDGFELLKALRADERTYSVPVILLSARAGEESRVEGVEKGADDYLVKPFSARELLARISARIEIARVQRESRAWLSAQKEAFQTAMNGAPLKESLNILTRAAIEGTRGAARCAFYIVDANGTGLHHVTGMSESYARCVDGFKIGPDSLACSLAVHSGSPRITPDVREEPRWKDWLWMAEEHGFRACWSFPVETSAGKVVGTFAMYFKEPRHAAPRDLELAAALTRTAAILISRQQEAEALAESERRQRALAGTLDLQVRDRTRELEKRNAEAVAQSELLRELSVRLLHAQDEERRHLARELHDSAGQTLAVLSIELQRVAQLMSDAPDLSKRMEDVQVLLNQLTQEIRTTSYLLHPPMLDEIGLAAALQWYVDGLCDRIPLSVELQIDEELGRLPAEAELSIFRIVQECLTNIHRHSGSRDAVIRISRDRNKLRLGIEDHGKGMPPEKLAELRSLGGGVGIRGMRERIRQLRGEIEIQSGASGTRISVTLPLSQAAPSANAAIIA